MKKLSLYIHIPVCTKKCYYCDFYSESSYSELIVPYIYALSHEWELVSRQFNLCDVVIDTIYLGGGTPSLLSEKLWDILVGGVFARLNQGNTMEWSIECNPDSFTSDKAYMYAQSGVNRLTFGIQSLFDEELKLLGRIHTVKRALDVLCDKSLEKFDSIGADLMYGIPDQTVKSFSESLQTLLNSSCLKHLSAYELMIEPATPLGRIQKKLSFPDEEAVVEMAGELLDITGQYGFNRYEISNFAKPGFNCRHNEIYWEHEPYIGLGASAHSYIHPYRWSNSRDIRDYIKMLNKGELPLDEKERIDPQTLAREMVFLGFRRCCGLNENLFEMKTGKNFIEWAGYEKIESFVKKGIINYQKPWYRLSESGFLIADAVAREFF